MTPKQKIILGVLGLLLIVIWVRALAPRRPAPPAISPANPIPLPAAPRGNAAGPGADVPESWGENPFLADRGARGPAVTEEPSSKDLIVLNGILWDPRTPSAILNNRVVSPGERLGEWKVLEIQKDRVILSNGLERRVVTASD